MTKSKLKLILSSVLMVLVLIQCSTTNTEDLETIEVEQPVQLTKPELISPVKGAENQSTTIELSWKFVENAQSYQVVIAEDANFDSSTVVDELIEEKSFQATLREGVTYYWKIRMLNNGKTGPWSDTWNFATSYVEKEPVQVELLAPEDGAEVSPEEELTFSWAIAGEGNYHFQISEDPAFNTIIKDSVIQSAEISISELEGEKEYYWRVNPILETETGAWSETRMFLTQAGAVTTEPADPAEPVNNSDFVTVQNGNFMLDGGVYRFAGSNAYHLPNYEKIDPSVVDRAMDSFQDAGVSVVRMWGFYDGTPQYGGDITLQPRAGEYNEEDLKRLDNVIAKGKEHGVRFVISLVNYWSQLGGMPQYNAWAGQAGGGMSAFINGAQQQKWFKAYISMLLNRVNTVTGVAYKDEPAIFSWEIMNEGRNRGADPTIIRDWYQEIAQYIKSIDSNHLVSTGEEGFDEGTPSEYSEDQYSNTYILRAEEGTSYIMNTQIPEIDYGTAHWYPGDWGWHVNSWDMNTAASQNLIKAQHAWIKDHSAIADNAGKPFLMGEYGFAGWGDLRMKAIYNDFWTVAQSTELDGSLLWQLTPDYVKCSEFGGNICYPGGRGDEELYLGFKAHIQAMNASK